MFLMPNCSLSIPNWETQGRPLTNQPTSVNFTLLKNDTLYFELANTQTVYMYFNLNLAGSNTVNYVVSIYDATTYNLVADIKSNSVNLSTNIDLLKGFYIVCLRSLSGSYTGTARADYYGFGRVVNFDPVVYESKQAVDFDLKIDPRRKPCDRPMQWHLVDGKLPPGLQLSSTSGLIFGQLPYLDCLDDPDDEFNTIPSANMFFTAGIGKYETVEPWGRRWNFKLRISMVDQPEHYDERWFCLLIYNDWTRTKTKFFNEYENGLQVGEIIKNVNDKKVEIGLCENYCTENKGDNEVIDEVIKEFLENGIQLDDDTDILHIEIPEIPDFDSDNPNSVNIYTRTNNVVNKKNYTIENDGVNMFGAYTNYQTTIEMDPEITNQRNVYVPEVQVGYISNDIMIELNSYEEYLGFRQYARFAKDDPNTRVYEYRESKLFNDFLSVSDKVKYEYIKYDPNEGIEGVEDSKGISDKVMEYIYIYYDIDKMPEVKKIEDMQMEQKSKAPISGFVWDGQAAEFSLTRMNLRNEVI